MQRAKVILQFGNKFDVRPQLDGQFASVQVEEKRVKFVGGEAKSGWKSDFDSFRARSVGQ